MLKEGKCFSNIIYNQKDVDTYSCTGASACGVISDVTGIRQEVEDKIAVNGTMLSLSFRRKVWERQLETGAIEGFGDDLKNGMVQAVKLFNEEFPDYKYILKVKRIYNIRDVEKMIDILKESSIHTGYTGALNADGQDNGIINNPDNVDGGGHAIRIVKITIEDNGSVTIKYCDNYEGACKYNIITIPNFQDNKDFFSGGYYIKKIFRN